MKKNPFISRLATSVAAVALTIGMAFTFSACSDDDEVVDPATTEPSRLSVPTVNEVAEADITTSSLKFSWAAVEGASSYSAQIRLSEAGDIYRERIVEDVTEVTFENLNDNTEYYFRVRANYKQNESRNSAYSVYTKAKTVAADPTIPQLAVPANVMCDKSKTTETELTFMWDSVENATAGYAVTLTSLGKDDVTATTTATTYMFTGLEKGVQYFFIVRACEVKEGDKVAYTASKNSGAVKATTVGQLDTPQNLKSQDKMSQAVRFVWDAVPNAKDYYYELQTLTVTGSSTVEDGLMTELSADIVPGQTVHATATTNTSMTFFGLEKATYYSFRVKAVSGNDAYNDSDFTDYCVIRTLETDATPLPAPILTIKEAQQLKVIVSWNMTGTYGYDIQFAPKATEVADDDATYTIEVRADETTHELATEYAITTAGADALTADTDYKVRIKTVANPNVLTDADSSWTEWKDVKTAALLNALTITPDESSVADAIKRMADKGVLTLSAGTYTGGGIVLERAITITADPAGEMPVIDLDNSSMNITNGVTYDHVIFSNVTIQGMKDYIFNTTSSQNYTINLFKVSNCVIKGLKRSIYRTQDEDKKTTVAEIVLENSTVVCTGNDTYGVFVMKSNVPAKYTISNCSFDKVQKLVDHSANNASEVTLTNCAFYQLQNKTGRSDAVLSLKGANGVAHVTKCVFASTNPVNKIVVGTLTTDTDNYFASDLVVTVAENTLPNATVLTETQAQLFPNVSSGKYDILSTVAPYATKPGDPRWYK